MSALDGEERAGSQPYQVIGVGHYGGFIEIVYAPDQAAFHIPPGAEIFHMKITHAQDSRGLRQIGANLRPNLHPAIKGGPQKRKCRLCHALMLQAQVRLHNRCVRTEPVLIPAS